MRFVRYRNDDDEEMWWSDLPVGHASTLDTNAHHPELKGKKKNPIGFAQPSTSSSRPVRKSGTNARAKKNSYRARRNTKRSS